MLTTSKKRPCSSALIYEPYVTMIVPIYNADKLLKGKIANLLALDYPADKIEYVFVSDGSTDKSNEILESNKSLKLIKLNKRFGKELALKAAIRQSKGRIVCLSDVSTHINPSGVKNLVRHFSNDTIGAVSSIDSINNSGYFIDNLLFKFEFYLREMESRLSSCIGVSGSFFAARKDLLNAIDSNCCSDLAIALECEKQGYRTIIENGAIGEYLNSINMEEEFKRKIRIITHGMNTVANYKELLNIKKYGFFAWQLISHKILRWITPLSIFILVILISFELSGILELAQLFYLFCIFTILLLIPLFRRNIFSNTCLFALYNIALFAAIFNIIVGNKFDVWEPTRR